MALAAAGRDQPKSASLPWRWIFETMDVRFPKANLIELEGMSHLLENGLRANEFLTSEFLFKGMTSRNRHFQARCVTLLLQRGLRKDVSAAAQASGPEVKFAALQAIVANPMREEALSLGYGPINDFLLACAKEDPGKTVDAIHEGSGWNTKHINLEPGIFLALEPYMTAAVSKGVAAPVEIPGYQEQDRLKRMLKMSIGGDRPSPRGFQLLRKVSSSKA